LRLETERPNMEKEAFPIHKRGWSSKRHIFSCGVLLIIAITYLIIELIPNKFSSPHRVFDWDVKSYYSYLPAYFIDHDIAISEWEDQDPYFNKYWPVYMGNGKYVIKTTLGISVFYAPFFAVANAVAAPLGYPADGFSKPYAIAILLSGAFFAWLGLLVLQRFLLRYYTDKVVAVTLAIIGLATTLLWYATYEAPMSHSYSFFLFAAFLYLTDRWYDKATWWKALLIGLVFGLIVLVRPSNGLVVIVFLLFGIKKWEDFPAKIKLYGKHWYHFLIVMAMVGLVLLPQLLYWKEITGHWIYYSYREERFFWDSPKIIEVLFGFRKGLFLYTPVLLVSLVGLYALWKKHRGMFWPLAVFFVINVYVISSWWCWWYGGSYAMRPFVESYAFLAVPVAGFIAWIAEKRNWVRYPVYIVVLFLSFRSVFHTKQYYNEIIHYEGMTKEAYFHTLWKTKQPADYWDYIELPDYEKAMKGDR